MPELPEIETIRRDLIPALKGHSVARVEVCDRRLMSQADERRLRQTIIGLQWEEIHRIGKYLVVRMDGNWQLIFHLRMTGQLVLRICSENQSVGILAKPLGRAHRLLLEFDNGTGLAFYDQRRFGEIFLKGPHDPWPGKTRLGPDALQELDADEFVSRLRSKTARIKPLLMDQRFLAGVGNIYAQEALFRADIRPMRASNRLSRAEAKNLFNALQETLQNAIRHRGSTSRDYRDAFGQTGTAQTLHAVYRRGGRPCLRCQTTLRTTRVGGRGTVFCPQCQH